MPTKLTTALFVGKAHQRHGNCYDYSKSHYVNAITKIIITCREHGEFPQTPNSHLNGSGCPQCGLRKCGPYGLSTQDDFIQRSQQVHGNKYDYSLVNYKNSRTKVIIVCSLHGSFSQTPSAHLGGSRRLGGSRPSQGCPECAGCKKKTTQEFIEKSRLIHGDRYDYSLAQYINSVTRVRLCCKIHGEFLQFPGSHLDGHGCSQCGKIVAASNRSRSRRLSFDFVKAEFAKQGCTLLATEYVNVQTLMPFICSCGRRWQIKWMNFRDGNRCGCGRVKAWDDWDNENSIAAVKRVVRDAGLGGS